MALKKLVSSHLLILMGIILGISHLVKKLKTDILHNKWDDTKLKYSQFKKITQAF